jgi:hypothetical protein
MDAEPTLAADVAEAETQGCYAWSQADDAEAVTTYIPRRSWKLPAAAIALASTAAIGAAVFLAWPQSAGKQQVAPPTTTVAAPRPTIQASPPVQPQDPDMRYAALYRSRGGKIMPGHERAAAKEARDVICESLATTSVADEISNIVRDNAGFPRYDAAVVTNTAIDVFCPQYSINK